MRKTLLYLIFGAVVVVMGYELYGLNAEANEAQNRFNKLNSEKETLLKDNEKLESEIDYFANPHNLEKELRARFNVRLPNEELIIVVPEGE